MTPARFGGVLFALVRSRGVARAVGLAMGLGLALLIPLGAVFGDAGRVLSAGLVVLGLLGVGVLAVGFGRLERVESA